MMTVQLVDDWITAKCQGQSIIQLETRRPGQAGADKEATSFLAAPLGYIGFSDVFGSE